MSTNYGITHPSSDFNKEDKGGDGHVTYLFGKRQSPSHSPDMKRNSSAGSGNSHKQSKNAGVGGTNYSGHGGSSFPAPKD